MEQMCYSDATVQSVNRRALAVFDYLSQANPTLSDEEVAHVMGYTAAAIDRIRDADVSQSDGYEDETGDADDSDDANDNTKAPGGYDFG